MLIHYGVTSPANLSFVYLFFRYVVGGAGDHQCQLGPPGPDVPRHPFGYVAALVSFQFFPLLWLAPEPADLFRKLQAAVPKDKQLASSKWTCFQRALL